MKVAPCGPFNSPAPSGLICPTQDFRNADGLGYSWIAGRSMGYPGTLIVQLTPHRECIPRERVCNGGRLAFTDLPVRRGILRYLSASYPPA